jgi:hypothetical protein
MCNYQVLSHNCYGYVVCFKHCNHFQVAFGTTVLSLTEAEYNQLNYNIKTQKFLQFDNSSPHQKNIKINTPSASISLVLSFNELANLIDLIEEANVMLEIENMLHFN